MPLPFTPVPFTLQPMVVLLGGAALGSRLGMTSQVLYLRARPRRPAGVRRVAGAAAGARAAARPDRRLPSELSVRRVRRRLARRARLRSPLSDVASLAMAAGLAIVFACGVAWLAWCAQPAASVCQRRCAPGSYPFLPADIIKIVLARPPARRAGNRSAIGKRIRVRSELIRAARSYPTVDTPRLRSPIASSPDRAAAPAPRRDPLPVHGGAVAPVAT